MVVLYLWQSFDQNLTDVRPYIELSQPDIAKINKVQTKLRQTECTVYVLKQCGLRWHIKVALWSVDLSKLSRQFQAQSPATWNALSLNLVFVLPGEAQLNMYVTDVFNLMYITRCLGNGVGTDANAARLSSRPVAGPHVQCQSFVWPGTSDSRRNGIPGEEETHSSWLGCSEYSRLCQGQGTCSISVIIG